MYKRFHISLSAYEPSVPVRLIQQEFLYGADKSRKFYNGSRAMSNKMFIFIYALRHLRELHCRWKSIQLFVAVRRVWRAHRRRCRRACRAQRPSRRSVRDTGGTFRPAEPYNRGSPSRTWIRGGVAIKVNKSQS